MDTLTVMIYILKGLALILPVIFHGYRLFKEIRNDHKRKSEPSVCITVAHLDGMEIIQISVR